MEIRGSFEFTAKLSNAWGLSVEVKHHILLRDYVDGLYISEIDNYEKMILDMMKKFKMTYVLVEVRIWNRQESQFEYWSTPFCIERKGRETQIKESTVESSPFLTFPTVRRAIEWWVNDHRDIIQSKGERQLQIVETA